MSEGTETVAAAEEISRLDNVSDWYRTTGEGFYTKILRRSYATFQPFFHGEHCLEMGPADGGLTQFLGKDFAKLSVVDASEQYLSKACDLVPGATAHLSLFEEFEPADRYDTIVMGHVLEHVNDPVQILSRARTWLAPGGRIIAAVPNADSLHRRLGVKMGLLERRRDLNDQDHAIGHRRVYNREELDHDVTAAGLVTVAKGGIFLKLLSNAQMLAFQDEQLVDAMFEVGRDLPDLCSEIYSVCVPA